MNAATRLTLYSYWRSSAAYRVRVALNLKGLVYETQTVNIAPGASQQHSAQYHALNPQHLVPVLIDGDQVIRQSLAIVEYLEETYPAVRLLPADLGQRARARELALLVACDIHPLNNLRVLRWLETEWQIESDQRERWVRHWITAGLRAFEDLLDAEPSRGTFCIGDTPGLADLCLAPQCYNAQRFQVDLAAFPRVQRIYDHCLSHPAFDRARPENQQDAPRA